MTVIAGIVQDGVVWMGADSLATMGWSLSSRILEEKIARRPVHVEDGEGAEMLLGTSGSVRMGQRVTWRLDPPTLRKGKDVFDWALEFADRFQELLAEDKGGRDKGDGHAHGRLLVGFQGRLFILDGAYGVVEGRHGYNAIGSGQELALGALYATRDLPPERRLRLALRAAARHDVYVSAPFQIERLPATPEEDRAAEGAGDEDADGATRASPA
jgi:ATP-dependent protease HslVU (ClpYQ) peptidase subunit